MAAVKILALTLVSWQPFFMLSSTQIATDIAGKHLISDVAPFTHESGARYRLAGDRRRPDKA